MTFAEHLTNLTKGVLLPGGILDQVAVVVCFFIVAFAFFAFRGYSSHLSVIEKAISACLAGIELAKERGTGIAAAVDGAFTASESLRSSWIQYRQGLVPDTETQGDERNRIVALVSADRLFSAEGCLKASGLNTAFYLGVPNLLVGLGLLFTFVGLTIALWAGTTTIAGDLANDPTNSSNTQALIPSLRLVLEATSFKFVTSLFGLLMSIAYSIAEKRRSHQFRKAVRQLFVTLDNVFPQYSAEAAAYHQRVRERALPEELADAIAVRLDGKFEAIIVSIRESISHIEGELRKGNRDALTEALRQLQAQFASLTEEQVEALRESLRMLGNEVQTNSVVVRDALKDGAEALSLAASDGGTKLAEGASSAQRSLAGAGQSLATVITDAGDRLQHDIGDSARVLVDAIQSASKEVVVVVTGAQTGLSEVLAGSTVLLASIKEASAATTVANEQFINATIALAKAMNQFATIASNLVASAKSLEVASTSQMSTSREISEVVVNVLDDVKKIGQFMGTCQTSLSELVSTATNLLADYIRTTETQTENFEKLDGALSDVFLKLSGGLHLYIEQVGAIHSQLEEGVAALTREIRDTVLEIRSLSEETRPSMTNLTADRHDPNAMG